jgi:transcriptional regulator GlxA family with amidase domain
MLAEKYCINGLGQGIASTDVSTRTVQFLLLAKLSLISLVPAMEVFRIANRLSERELYRCQLVAKSPFPMVMTNGMAVTPDYDIATAPRADYVFVCASFEAQILTDPEIFQWLRRNARHGVQIGGIAQGVYVLARAGLLDGYRCTAHWENRPALVEDFPSLDIKTSLYEIDRDRMTCAGCTASLDMMMQVVARDHGADLAVAISSHILHDRIRTPNHPQPFVEKMVAGGFSPKLDVAVTLMERNIEHPLPIPALCAMASVGQRQFERLFRGCFGISPQQYYLNIRLRRARLLIQETTLPTLSIALATGFGSQGYFSRCYRAAFGITPSKDRRKDRTRRQRESSSAPTSSSEYSGNTSALSPA